MYLYPPLWERGARGDFISIILKSPFIPLCQRGIKTHETEGLQFLVILPRSRHSAEFSDVGLTKKAPAFPDAFVFNTSLHERINFLYKKIFLLRRILPI